MELSDREIKLVHCMFALINPNLKEVPQEIRNNTIMATLKVRNFEYDEAELVDIVQAINSEIQLINKSAYGMLGKYGHLLKDLGHTKL